MEGAALDQLEEIISSILMLGALIWIMMLNVLAFRKQWLSAMIEQAYHQDVIHQDRININIGRGLDSLGYLFMPLSDDALGNKPLRFPSIRTEVRALRRLTRSLFWIAMAWACLLVSLAIIRANH
ncbi:MAG: hypothetical protein JNM91_03085 [Flavobacteriales bacterium]|nr:hypothetical protein [Flavobacteriales bacterium]